jgi:hypothetical protein
LPADVELLPVERILLTRAWGALVDEDIVDHMVRTAAMFRDGTLDGDWAQIVDFTAVADVDGITTAGIRRAAEGNPWPRYAVRVFVVSTDEQFGLARMYQAMGRRKTDDLNLTRSAEEARAIVRQERIRLGIAI